MGFTPCFLCVNGSSLGPKYTGRTVTIATSSSVSDCYTVRGGWLRSLFLSLWHCWMDKPKLLKRDQPSPLCGGICTLSFCPVVLDLRAFRGAMHREPCTNTQVTLRLGRKAEEAAGTELTSFEWDQWFPGLQPLLPLIFCIHYMRYFLLKYKSTHTLNKKRFNINTSIHLFTHSMKIYLGSRLPSHFFFPNNSCIHV